MTLLSSMVTEGPCRNRRSGCFTSQRGTGDIFRADDGRFIVTLTDSGLSSAGEALNTIAHEVNHIREILKKGPGFFIDDEKSATLSGNLAQRYMR